ncbi:MAG: HlyD family efflux transporter periplasmic adaptor subunit [Synechococcus sp.]|nr:HlyD family efflux transporter periplasmic adaptor subunit [Synechococcus sp.]
MSLPTPPGADEQQSNAIVPSPGGGLKPLAHQEVRYKAAPTWTRALQWAIVGIVGFGVVYAVVARIDEVVIAKGELQGMGAERPIKAPVQGVVSAIPVKEGQEVKPGQVLLQFDPDVNKERLSSLKQQKQLEAQRLDKETVAFAAREDSLEAKLASLKLTLATNQDILNRMQPLVEQGAMSEVQYLQQKNQLQEVSSEIAQSEARLREVQAESIKNIQQIRRELANLQRQIVETSKAQEYEALRSPIRGHVFDLVPSSPGYAASNGETLLKIVPIGAVEAQVFVNNANIGFLRPKMAAQVRVDAYPFTQFGDIPGQLKSIGKEALPPDQQNPESRFSVMVSLERQFLERKGKRYPISAGQSVAVNFIVRDKPVISLLTDAVEKSLDSLRGVKTDQP